MKINKNQLKEYSIFELGTKITDIVGLKENFTGEVWLNMVYNDTKLLNTAVGNVTFANNSRSNWHYHSSEQLLFAIAGEGWYCEANKTPILLKKGDVIKIPKETKHWHGATNNSYFVQLVFTPGETIWLKKVSNEEYNLTNLK